MQEIELSDGSVLELPADMPDDQVRVMVNQAEAQLHPPETMTGANPNPSDDSWFPENEPFPGYTIGHEALAGATGAIADIPDWPSHLANSAQEVYDLHFGSGEGKVAYPVPDLVGGKAAVEELNPQTPGWDRLRSNSGLAASAGVLTRGSPQAMMMAPLLNEGATALGGVFDDTIDRNDNQKWARTLPLLTPTLGRGGAFAARKLPSMTVGGATSMLGGDFGTGVVLSDIAKGTIAAKRAVAPPPGIAATLGMSVAPYTDDERRLRY